MAIYCNLLLMFPVGLSQQGSIWPRDDGAVRGTPGVCALGPLPFAFAIFEGVVEFTVLIFCVYVYICIFFTVPLIVNQKLFLFYLKEILFNEFP